MNYLSADHISKSFNEKILFNDISMGVSKGEKVALVGHNGSGKTTLLNILSGRTSPDGGTVVIRKEITMGYLDQDPVFPENNTVLQALFTGSNPMLDAIKEYEDSLSHPENKGLQQALEKMDSLKAWDYEQQVKEIVTRLGLSDFTQKISTLSGGQRKRLALARLLIEKPSLIIMDEPTNHLDLETVEWLENMLGDQNLTLLLVTHDRYFLDKVCNRIYELNRGSLFTYKGNYSYFVEKKAERELQQQTEIEKAKNLLKKELEWMRRQPKARGTKAKSRVDAFYELQDKATEKKPLQKMELDVKTTRQGNKIFELEHVTKQFGDKTLVDNFSYVFKKKDRIGIVGKNGVGKSTFLNMLAGLFPPDQGNISKGDTTVVGYFSQKGLEMKEDKRVIDVVKDIAEVITLGSGEKITVSRFLEYFLFPPPMQYTFVSRLSGGEKKRLQLLQVLVTNPNFLILDEPTNDLDIDTLNVLEDFLLSFQGSLLIVSHDRYFMDKLTDHLFVFEGEGKIRDFPGNYTDYREWSDERELLATMPEEKKAEPVKAAAVATEPEKKKLTFAERKEYETLEKEISSLEAKKDEITQKLASGQGSSEDIVNMSKEFDRISKEIEQKTERWMELSERA